MFKRILIALASALMIPTPGWARDASLIFLVIVDGTPVEAAQVASLERLPDKTDFAATCQGLACVAPAGSFRFRIDVEAGHEVSGTVRVSENRETFLPVVLPEWPNRVGEPVYAVDRLRDDEQDSIRGYVKGFPVSGGNCWLTLQSLGMDRARVSARIDRQGRFVFPGLFSNTFVTILFCGGEPVLAEVMKIPAARAIRITIDGGAISGKVRVAKER